ncbi:MAG: cobaltochelatase subunit CobN, partial [Pseudomonadota bacterium]
MRDDGHISGYRVVIVTLDAHAAAPAARVSERLSDEFPGLSVAVHAAAEWGECPEALDRARDAIAHADIVIANLLFLEEHVQAILPALEARRDGCDAMVGIVADPAIVKLTRMGDLDMSQPASGAMALLKRLRGSSKPSAGSGEKQMKMLRRIPKILKWIPGKAQDLRAWFLTMQYWLGGSDDNVEGMVRFLVSRYAHEAAWRGRSAEAPIEYPEVGLYHPDLPERITTEPARLPVPDTVRGTVGLLMMRSYVLAGDTAHYDAVIRAFEAKGLRCLPAFAGGLDGRPPIEAYFQGEVDALVSLTGFSLIGGPAYNDSDAAVEVLKALDVPYIAAHPLEFQTLEQWDASSGGLGPVETTMLIALPEIDGATNPTVFAGRHGSGEAMAPCNERVAALAEKTLRLAVLRQSEPKDRKLGIVLFGFPPNAGATGTAAYLSVF